jgi:hypothetical protein
MSCQPRNKTCHYHKSPFDFKICSIPAVSGFKFERIFVINLPICENALSDAVDDAGTCN